MLWLKLGACTKNIDFYSYLCTVQWNEELLRKLLILVF